LIFIFVKVVGISYQAKINIFGVCIYKPVACLHQKLKKEVDETWDFSFFKVDRTWDTLSKNMGKIWDLPSQNKHFWGLYIQTRSLPSPKIEKNVWANGGQSPQKWWAYGGQMKKITLSRKY